jgi:hypothetical protein
MIEECASCGDSFKIGYTILLQFKDMDVALESLGKLGRYCPNCVLIALEDAHYIGEELSVEDKIRQAIGILKDGLELARVADEPRFAARYEAAIAILESKKE